MELDWIANGLGQNLDAKHQAREQGLTLCRKAIRLSANSIRAIHRGQKQEGEDLLDQARLALDEAADPRRNVKTRRLLWIVLVLASS